MAASSKWLQDVDTSDPVAHVAQVAIQGRLKAVEQYLPLAAYESHHDVEYVHQLRVATRRARAAVDLFQPVLPKKRSRWLKRWLRRIRRAAGRARDLDVMQDRLSQQVHECDTPLISLLGALESQRRRAGKPLRKVCRRAQKKRFSRRWRKLIGRIQPRDSCSLTRGTFGPYAQQALTDTVNAFFAEADRLDAESDASLHRLRIAGKRLRYTIELVVSAFNPTLRKEIYPAVEALQKRLGTFNDHVTAAQFFRRAAHRMSDKHSRQRVESLSREERALADQARREFLDWWNSGQRDWLRRRLLEVVDGGCSRKTA